MLVRSPYPYPAGRLPFPILPVSSYYSPDFCHSANRLYTVFHTPYRSGRSRHGTPVRITHKMPFSICLSSFLGLPSSPAFRSGKCFFYFMPSLYCHVVSPRLILRHHPLKSPLRMKIHPFVSLYLFEHALVNQVKTTVENQFSNDPIFERS